MHPEGQRSEGTPRPASWTHRALGAGGRALGSAGHALTHAEQRGAHHLGTAHLGGEALVAYVDGELAMVAHQRAAAHLAVCTECASDVQAQLQARAAVRSAGTPCTPAGLLGALRQIPDAQAPGPTPRTGPTLRGAVIQDENGAWVSVLRPDRFGGAASPDGTVSDGTVSDGTVSDGTVPGAAEDAAPHRRHGFPLVVLTVSALAVGVLVAAPSPTDAPFTGSGAAPVHTARLSGPVDPASPAAGTVVVGVALPPQTATSPAAGQAVPVGVPAPV